MDSISYIWNPIDTDGLIKFYFIWIILLFSIHVFRDRYSKKTSRDNFSGLQHKVTEIYSAATVTGSILLCSMMLHGFKDHPLFGSDIVYLPMVLSIIIGFLVGLSGLSLKTDDAIA